MVLYNYNVLTFEVVKIKTYSAIREMYYGRRGDGQLIQPSEEYHERNKKLNELVEKLQEKLKEDKEGLKLLDDFFWASASTEAAATDQHYREGFAFGVLMGLEIAGMQ